jgi:hypothetical protein
MIDQKCRRCRQCNEVKLLGDFYRYSRNRGYYRVCKACVLETAREYRRLHKPPPDPDAPRRKIRAKLTTAQVAQIRRRLLAGDSIAKLARAYGISPGAVGNIKHGRTWAEVPPAEVAAAPPDPDPPDCN